MFECEERIAETAEEDAAREAQREQQEIQQMLATFDLDKMGPETTMPESEEEEESEEESEEEVFEVSRTKTRRKHLDVCPTHCNPCPGRDSRRHGGYHAPAHHPRHGTVKVRGVCGD
jgi:hypothetical protein